MVANWKMNPIDFKGASSLYAATKKHAAKQKNVQTIVCPGYVHLALLAKGARSTRCLLGAQDCAVEKRGAFTGDISAEQLADIGAQYVIVGHSERRAIGETNENINKKIKSVRNSGLIPIVCIGEQERDSEHKYLDWLRSQIKETFAGLSSGMLKKMIIAYEPIWAIGANADRSATPNESLEMVIFIKQVLADLYSPALAENIPVLYGGSVNSKNIDEFLREGGIDGVLVGGASLDAKQFGGMLMTANTVAKEQGK